MVVAGRARQERSGRDGVPGLQGDGRQGGPRGGLLPNALQTALPDHVRGLRSGVQARPGRRALRRQHRLDGEACRMLRRTEVNTCDSSYLAI